MIATNCGGCVFADVDAGPNVVPTQTGCKAGRLEVLTARPGVRVDMIGPDFVIEGALCAYKRQDPWKGTPETVRGEMKTRCKIRLFVLADFPEVETIETTVESATGFWKISVIPVDVPPPRPEVVAWLRDHSPAPWTVDWYHAEKRHWSRILDDAVADCESQFYVVAEAGTILPENLAERIKSAVVDRDKSFLALEGENFTVVQTKAHQWIGGNAPVESEDGVRRDGVLEKLRHVAADKGLQFVFPAGEVLPCL